jgi:hypothetical protein
MKMKEQAQTFGMVRKQLVLPLGMDENTVIAVGRARAHRDEFPSIDLLLGRQNNPL